MICWCCVWIFCFIWGYFWWVGWLMRNIHRNRKIVIWLVRVKIVLRDFWWDSLVFWVGGFFLGLVLGLLGLGIFFFTLTSTLWLTLISSTSLSLIPTNLILPNLPQRYLRLNIKININIQIRMTMTMFPLHVSPLYQRHRINSARNKRWDIMWYRYWYISWMIRLLKWWWCFIVIVGVVVMVVTDWWEVLLELGWVWGSVSMGWFI